MFLVLASAAVPRLISLNLLTSNFSNARKYYVKALQRLGLTFLPAVVRTWRYKRGYRSLEDNMKLGGPRHDDGDGDGKENLPPTRNAPAAVPVDQEEDIDVPEVVEQIIGTTSL